MTREVAIEIFKRLKENAPNEMHLETVESAQELFGMAIQALSQEPCDDAISRDFQIGDEVRIIGSDPIYDDCDVGWVIRNASEKVKTMYVMRNDGSADEEAKAEWYKTGRHNAMLAEVIKALPSVTQKSGKWIPASKRLPEKGGEYLITWTGVCGKQRSKPLIGIAEYEIYEPENYEDWITTDNEFRHYHDIKVLAWQELPEPYEPQESEARNESKG